MPSYGPASFCLIDYISRLIDLFYFFSLLILKETNSKAGGNNQFRNSLIAIILKT